MASTYSTNLALELIGTGDQSGTWGNTTNTNLGTLIEQAISGYVTQAITDGADTTITIPNGATGVARNMAIEMTGALTAARNLIVPANKKLYFIYNNTTGGFAVTVKVSGQTGVSVPNGKKMLLVSNGTDIVEAVNAHSTLAVAGAATFGSTTSHTGVASFADGTVGTPGLNFSSDTDSGIYRIGANNIGIGVNGAKVLDIGTTGLGLTGNLTSSGTNASAAFGGTLSTWSGMSGIELGGSGAAVAGQPTSGNTYVFSNAYYNSGYKRKNATYAPAMLSFGAGDVVGYYAGTGAADSAITWTTTFSTGLNGNSFVGPQAVDQFQFLVYSSSTAKYAFMVFAADVDASVGTTATVKIGRTSTNGRSVSAQGTINASGTDYAEYERKNLDCGVIAKGDIVGYDENGMLTDKWGQAISFGVKSTDPSYVGGDKWGSPDKLGVVIPRRPQKPGPDGSELDMINYNADLAKYDLALERLAEAQENARQTVDRIAYSGKVPVNGIASFNVGDYIIPVQDGDGIGGIAVTEPTFDQYRKAVGQVRRVLPDGRPEIAVKVG